MKTKTKVTMAYFIGIVWRRRQDETLCWKDGKISLNIMAGSVNRQLWYKMCHGSRLLNGLDTVNHVCRGSI